VRVAVYRRISTDEERQPFSLDVQQERLAAYVAAQPGWALTRSYSDRMSGKRLDRPGLQQALHDARTGRYDLLLVFKVDRLARSTGGLAKVLEQLDAGGVAFRSASEPFDTSTAAGRMMMQMLGVFAEFEREMIVERTRMGLARKAARGEWTGGTPPIGYRYDAEAQTLIPVPMQAALVQRIFTLYVDRRLGSAAISGQLNDAGQLTSRGYRGHPTVSWACYATPPTSDSYRSTATAIRPAMSPSSTASCSSGHSSCSQNAQTHRTPKPPTPATTC
jgi:site-specific DNA recombinase